MLEPLEREIRVDLEIAIELATAHKLSILPTKPGLKRPLLPAWQECQHRRALPHEIASWYVQYGALDLAAAMGPVSGERGLYVLDFDRMDDFDWWVRRFGGSPVMTRTPRPGLHLFYDLDGLSFGNRAGLFGRKIDGRGAGGYVVVHGCHASGRSYERIGWTVENFAKLPKVNPEWLAAKTTSATARGPRDDSIAERILKCRRYLSRIKSIAGQGGNMQLFRAALACTKTFELPADVALALLIEWQDNGGADPKWPIQRLEYKIQESLRVKRSNPNEANSKKIGE